MQNRSRKGGGIALSFVKNWRFVLVATVVAVLGSFGLFKASPPLSPIEEVAIYRFTGPKWNLEQEQWPQSGLDVAGIRPEEILYHASGWEMLDGQIALASLVGRLTYYVPLEQKTDSASIRVRARTWGSGATVAVRVSADGDAWSGRLISQQSHSRNWTEITQAGTIPAEFLEPISGIYLRLDGFKPTVNEFVQLAGFEVALRSTKSVNTQSPFETLAQRVSKWIFEKLGSIRQAVEVRDLYMADEPRLANDGQPKDNSDRTFGPPYPASPMGVAAPDGIHSNIRLDFEKPIKFDALSVFFPGDLHGYSSRLPRSIDLYFRTGKQTWTLADRTRNFAQSVYDRRFASSIQTDAIRFRVADPADGKDVAYTDVSFFRNSSANPVDAVGQTLSDNRRHPVAYIAYILAFLILIITPGYAILDLARRHLSIRVDPAPNLPSLSK